MPYKSVADLPEQFNQYSEEGRRAALATLNGCLYEGNDKSRCFAAAHTAAKDAQSNSQGGGAEGGPQRPA